MSSESFKKRLKDSIVDPEKRRAFAEAQLGPNISAQIRALREDREWFQGELGGRAGMKQTQIARLENPSYENFSLNTLRRLAEAFDVALVVRFVPFSEMIEWVSDMSFEKLAVAGFDKELEMAGGCKMKSAKKYKDMVHYIISRSKNPADLGAIKLNKILWYADTLSYRATGAPISGEAYVKRKLGPVPKGILKAIKELRAEKKITVAEPSSRFKPREFVSIKKPDLSNFVEPEQEIIDAVFDEIVENHTAMSISDLSHDAIWDAAEIGEDIPIYAVFAAKAAPVTHDDMAWADKIIETRHR